jgi:transcriptional regulator with GAF, ATPase, and Fis domain/tetratricopeptide (TPR) repeat protein
LETVNKVGSLSRGGKSQELLAERYRVLDALSEGAQGQVLLVADTRKNDRCVVKVLPGRHAATRLRVEFAQLTKLSHPGVVRVRDAGVFTSGPRAGLAYLATDYLAGPSLADALAAGPDATRATRFATAAEALADALSYLHGQGIVHGDVSPANIRCDEAGRPILIDFGLADSVAGEVGPGERGVSGTLGFVAPEALLGERGPAGDLFALGATLYEAWTGVPPFGLGLEAVRRAWQGPPALPSSLRPGLCAAWDRLLLRLLAGAREDRPRSAREALQEIRLAMPGRPISVETDLVAPFPAGDPFAGVLVGRDAELARLRRCFEQLAQGTAATAVVCVLGPAGIGRHALVRQAVREARLSVLSQSLDAITIEEAECTELVAQWVGADLSPGATDLPDPAGQDRECLAALVAEIERRAAIRPLALVLSGSSEDVQLARTVAGAPASGRLLVLLTSDQTVATSPLATIELGPLPREAVGALIRRGAGVEAPVAVLDRIMTASAGVPGPAVLLIRAWLENARAGRPESLSTSASELDMAHLLDRSLAALSHPARALVVARALSPVGVADDGHATGATLAESDLRAEHEARAAGWSLSAEDRLPSDAHVGAVWRAIAGDGRLQRVARTASAQLPPGDSRRAEVQWALGEHAAAAVGFWQAMRAAEDRRAWSKVAHFGQRALVAGDGRATDAQRMSLSYALGILGRYDEALKILDGCNGPESSDGAARIVERKAWLLGRRGDPEGAQRVIEAALNGLPVASADAQLLRARLARLLVARGNYTAAFGALEPVLRLHSRAAMAIRESAVLALAYAGKLDAAEDLLAGLRGEASESGDAAVTARVAALEGLLLQLAGQPLAAADAYRRALEDYEVARDRHGEAAATFNLGCTLAEIGDYGDAIAALERAVRELGRLGARTDHALAVFNVGLLFLQLGDLDATSRASERLRGEAQTEQGRAFAAHAEFLTAELQRRRRAGEASLSSYAAAARQFAALGMQAMATTALLGRAETLGEMGRADEARAALADCGDVDPSGNAPSGEAFLLARGRLMLREPNPDAAAVRALAETLVRTCEKAQAVGRRPVAWRAASLAAGLFARAADPRQASQQVLAKAMFEEVKMKTPAKYWSGLEGDLDARLLGAGQGNDGSAAVLAERSAVLEGRLRRLLRINKRLNSELRLARVLETIIDTVIEITDAERGFLLLKDAGGELVVKVARNIDQTTLEGPGLALSRSIAKQAADTGEPVITVDAAGDSRFAEHLSVSDLHLRSVLAVPLAVKGRVVGTIYVDHRLRKGVFGDAELAVVLDFADQGAIAIENARIISELRRREQQVQSLNRRLERELRVQEAELSDARIELKESRQAAALRYDYRQIVGQSPGMLELFRLLDRVTDTNLPVVIEGESGTGKELVARAIHYHGPRKDQAFVSENCAAIPETLLESALFGHTRGAFTGAEREARGLFAVADGGTLFLDEVADMSAGMQGKLLRVLQDGEFHRVGSERVEKADVRVVVASNRNLAQMVEDGRFRKDLFYRLSVVRLHLPPLRERREDIPLLAEHFLQKAVAQTGGTAKRLEPAALARLSAYTWPGNVRELENELTRASAFSGQVIAVSDLSPQVQNGQDPSEVIRNEPDSLRLHQRVERLERQLIREAMARAQGNQTKAAALLGLSRFGLQKKLRRYNLGT